MGRHRRAAAVALGALAVSAPARAADVFTLQRDLVFGPSVLASRTQEVPFELPAGARQGEDAWYLVRLHYRIELEPHSRAGRAYVLASTNGEACAQITYLTRRDAEGLLVEQNELGLVRGARIVRSRSTVHELTFRNFLLLSGVRGGRNVLTVEVQQHEGARVRSVRVYADSAIERSPYGPARLDLEPVLDSRRVELGARFTVGFRVRNPSDRVAAPGSVRVETGEGLSVRGRASAPFARVRPGAAAEGSFELVADDLGEHDIGLAANSLSGSPAARVQVEVVRGEGSRSLWWTAAAFAVVVCAAVAALLRDRRRRKMGRSAH
jgi:hypothetical protein